jgi:hypothetical protein
MREGLSMRRLLTLLVLMGSACLRLPGETLSGSTTAEFSGTSTLHAFTGTATSETFAVEWTPLPDNAGLLSSTNLSFKVSSLNTAHAKRDRNMVKMFGSTQNITGSLTAAAISAGESPPLTVNIGTASQTVPLHILSCGEQNGQISFTGEFELSLKACGLKPPSVIGLIRVGDAVKVKVQTMLVKP